MSKRLLQIAQRDIRLVWKETPDSGARLYSANLRKVAHVARELLQNSRADATIGVMRRRDDDGSNVDRSPENAVAQVYA